VVPAGAGTGYDPSAGWCLVWSDEFGGAAVDPASWTFDLGSGGWGNNESQYYRAENAAVTGGFLTITAREEAFGDALYTSARLQTSQKRAFTYGKFSMRAKLPYSQAMWPAFWLLGANSSSFDLYGGSVAWPGCGEADIMEMVGGLADGSGDFTTHGALHYLDASGRNPGPSAAYRHASRLSEDFHVYELIWTPHSFTWLFDGLAFGTRVITADMEEFSRPMFILLNLAVGGPWGGWVDASTVFPQTYVIDYVRVYANATTAPGGAPGLATSWHLLDGPAAGVTPAGETLASTPGTVTGFQPTRALTAPATWYSAPLTGSYEAGAWSVGLFTTSPAAASVLQVEVFKTAADGSDAASLGSARLDVSATGGGNHRSWFTLTGVPVERFADQRLKVVVTPVSGATATMIYNGNDFDSVVTTPWSAAGP
jgi:beta-glucanase (GH16 family)